MTSVQIDKSGLFARRSLAVWMAVAVLTASAATWGVQRYDLETWDDAAGAWKAVVSESGSQRMKMARVHPLPAPVRLARFRVVVREVAPADQRARLLQVEAWGRP